MPKNLKFVLVWTTHRWWDPLKFRNIRKLCHLRVTIVKKSRQPLMFHLFHSQICIIFQFNKKKKFRTESSMHLRVLLLFSLENAINLDLWSSVWKRKLEGFEKRKQILRGKNYANLGIFPSNMMCTNNSPMNHERILIPTHLYVLLKFTLKFAYQAKIIIKCDPQSKFISELIKMNQSMTTAWMFSH